MTGPDKQTPYPATSKYEDLAYHYLTSEPSIIVSDRTGEVRFGNDADYQKFVDSGASVAEYLDNRERQALVDEFERHMPPGDFSLPVGVAEALSAAISRLQEYSRKKVLETDTTDDERYELMRGERDLSNAFAGIVTALDLYDPDGGIANNSTNYDYFLDTHAWYMKGRRGRNGGYVSTYEVCNDTYYPDDEDHASELSSIRAFATEHGVDEQWPDEFHHPAKLEIRVDPAKRIEFVYTPMAESAKSRHASTSEVVARDGKTRVYENESLSIRIDLDPTSPSGIALDIGRNEYDGERDGKRMRRNADLLGGLLARTSETGSHEYTGLTPDMADEFKVFAEKFAVQLDLQHKEFRASKRRQGLAQAGLRLVS